MFKLDIEIRESFILIAILAFFSVLMYNPAENQFLQVIKIVSGIIVLLFIPGLCLAQFIFGSDISVGRSGFALLFGLLIQSLNILLLYSVGSLFLYKQIDFEITLILMTLFFVVLISFISLKRCSSRSLNEWTLHFRENWFSNEAILLYILFAVSLIVRLYYQRFSFFPTTDGAYYMSMARILSATGEFTSKVFYEVTSFH